MAKRVISAHFLPPKRLDEPAISLPKEDRKDIASDAFPRDHRSGLGVCVAWLSGLFSFFLVTTLLVLRRLKRKEVG